VISPGIRNRAHSRALVHVECLVTAEAPNGPICIGLLLGA